MKQTLLTSLLALAIASPAFAASGIFGTGVVLGVNGTKTLYATTLLNDSRHTPVNVTTPTMVLSGLPSNLGTFDLGIGNSLTLMGGEELTFKNGTDNVTGATIFYRIDGGSFNSFALTFNQNVNGSGDQRWYGEGANSNLLTGLTNGTHTLQVYYEAPFTYTGSPGFGTHVVNNGAANYSASFTLVPEPSAALLGCIGALALLRRRR